MSFLTNRQGTIKITLPLSPQQKFTIGRTPQNSLQVVDPTVSKNHALIFYIAQQKKYVLEDLGSINGTWLNQKQVSASKVYLKHNDEIVFGKSDQKYVIKYPNPQPDKKGKINFKDYNFQLEDQIDVKPILQIKNKPKQPVNIESKTQTSWKKDNPQISINNENKQKFERAIKIPNFEQFLQIEGQEFVDKPYQVKKESQMKNKEQDINEVKKWGKNADVQKRKRGVKLPQLNKVQLNEEDRLNKMIIQRKRQLQRAEKQAMLRKTQQQQRMIEQRLRLEIQKAEQQQEMLRQKYEIQKRAEEEQKNLIRQRTLLEQRVKLQQKQARQKEELRQLQLKQKQEALVKQMMKNQQLQMLKLKEKEEQILRQVQEQKEKEVSQIKELQTKKRIQKEEEIKQSIQNRKRQLQLQAEALTRQYENIYKETIKKLKLNIEAQQSKVDQVETQIDKLNREIIELNNCITVQQQQFNRLKEQYNEINGRNKAFLLYGSHLQTKIDKLKQQIQKSSIKDPSKTSLQIKDSLIHSRKLLNMKLNEQKELQNQIRQSFIQLNLTSPQSQQYLSTIFQNYQQIQRLKELYFQLLQEEKVIESKWDLQLEDNTALEEKVRNLKKQIQGNKKKLAENLNDNMKKLTQQRLHMLKMMQYIPEEKKTAAKYLIQQMVNIQQENKAIILDSEQTHSKITQLIISIEQKKLQNQQLSEILFGNNSLSHHFDNMKDEINKLISHIQSEKDELKINNLIKMGHELRQLQNKLYLQAKQENKLKQQFKNTHYTVAPLNTEKNPLVFFGKLLNKKQNQLNQTVQNQKLLQKQLQQARNKTSALNDKKNKLTQLLQDYKQKQLLSIKDYLKSSSSS